MEENNGTENGYSPYNTEEYKEKLPYPKSVFFIVSNEFCERFSYYGMRTILVIYLTNILFYSEADAKIIYHTFTMFVYFFPVLGAILSDSFLGKFNTILYVSMVYAGGSVLLALSATDPIGLPKKEFSIIGLLLIALGTGGIKPCVSAFGGDQFVLPQQELQFATFFSLFYFAINAGSLISTFLTPVLRNNVHCFGNESCFPLAFAVPGILMIISIVIFAAGRPLYRIKKPEGNVIVQAAKCISHAISRKYTKCANKKDHWLDYAEEQYGKKLVSDIKSALHVMVLYLPLPIFWALYDQQGSGWTFQAVRMDGNIGFYTILPDQMQVVNPLLILSFIPLFSYYVYPLLGRCNLLKTPLQRMVCGGFLAAVAFAVSALVSIAIESHEPILPSTNNIQLRIYNPSTSPIPIKADGLHLSAVVPSMSAYVRKDVPVDSGTTEITFEINATKRNITVQDAHAYGIFIYSSNDSIYYTDNVAKSETGYPVIRTLVYGNDESVVYSKGSDTVDVEAGEFSTFQLPGPGKWSIEIGNETLQDPVDFQLGGTYTVMINKDEGLKMSYLIVTEPNSIHMAWLLPQYFIITAAEIMFSITGLEFSYTQAPVTMKSLLQACFLLTTAFGNLIIVIVESAKIFEKQSNDFFLYTGLMVADMLLFTYMATKYRYINNEQSETTTEISELSSQKGIDNPTFVKA
ncbi:peptide transporter family 1-like isoform X3 [Diorhabda sublineata]|uniref:peptide transporter family 1-like isoform X3 n=2 Tax=Diorhabda sublineata TaxID=1163346 RepID=UPI0024E0FFA6|nr:peptide transporter family 1-like isoform X3 [Diorhabda sublineata]